jgi:hypothetical protein
MFVQKLSDTLFGSTLKLEFDNRWIKLHVKDKGCTLPTPSVYFIEHVSPAAHALLKTAIYPNGYHELASNELYIQVQFTKTLRITFTLETEHISITLDNSTTDKVLFDRADLNATIDNLLTSLAEAIQSDNHHRILTKCFDNNNRNHFMAKGDKVDNYESGSLLLSFGKDATDIYVGKGRDVRGYPKVYFKPGGNSQAVYTCIAQALGEHKVQATDQGVTLYLRSGDHACITLFRMLNNGHIQVSILKGNRYIESTAIASYHTSDVSMSNAVFLSDLKEAMEKDKERTATKD